MSIFDGYESKEALLKDVEAAITEETNDDGVAVFKLPNKLAEALTAKYDAEVKNAKRQREKKQEAESKLAELTELREKELLELEELRKSNPQEIRQSLKRYVDETASARSRIKELEGELEPLRKKNEEYRTREIRQRIEDELVTNALKMNCCETALRDVKRLAPMFHMNDAGVPMTDDGKLVVEVLQDEVEKSPHWLKRSQSANAAPGTAGMTSEARFREALKGNDFAAVLANAPRQQVR